MTIVATTQKKKRNGVPAVSQQSWADLLDQPLTARLEQKAGHRSCMFSQPWMSKKCCFCWGADAPPRHASLSIRKLQEKDQQRGSDIALFYNKAMHIIVTGSRFIAKRSSSWIWHGGLGTLGTLK
ncbi:hypothetical protein P3342_006115 [Pyrenophora teres f. teres]|nr:hypothetical protein P3342_006115 [Pyrenophora teres f. teres]